MAITKVSRGLLSTGISDSSDATAITIDSSEKVGIGETSPLGTLHVKTADSGASADSGADELVLENSGDTGITIMSGTSNSGSIRFGDSADNDNGIIIYNHGSSPYMRFFVDASERMRIDSSGVVFIGGTAHFSGGSNADDATVAVNGGVTRKGIAFSDFNEAYVNDPKGIFEGTGTYQASNGPSGAGNFFHLVSKTLATSGSSANNYVTQVATSITGTIHTRYSSNNGSSWTSWQQV